MIGSAAPTVNDTLTVCGLFCATSELMRTFAVYVPAASSPVAGCSTSVVGAVVPVSAALSHPAGWPAV
jgi:hypothetical protein